MEDLIKKLGHRIPEVSDRAVKTINSKLSAKLTSISTLLSFENGILCGLILHWINQRQTEADVQTISAALKILRQAVLEPRGHRLVLDLGGKEFLDAYSKYAPQTLHSSISDIMNALVSPSFQPLEEPKILPKKEKPKTELPQVTRNKPTKKEVKYEDFEKTSIEDPCEFPPVMLLESDEKVLFDLGVTLKYGNPDEILESCEEVQLRVLEDFPADCLLQRTDLILSLTGLVKTATSKGVVSVAYKGITTIGEFLSKLENFSKQVAKPEFRVATYIPKKSLSSQEHLELSYPCLKNEQWEVGTPGSTLSLLAGVELLVTSLPLNEPSLIGASISAWDRALWALPKLLKFPKLVKKLFDSLGESIHLYVQNSNTMQLPESKVLIRSILELGIRIMLMLPVNSIADCLSADSELAKYLSDYFVFQGEDCTQILPYIEAIDPQATKEYQHAQKVSNAIHASLQLNQILAAEKHVPVSSPKMLHNALDFFEKLLAGVEFSSVPTEVVIDLNIYSYILVRDSALEINIEKANELLLAMMSCKLEPVRTNCILKMKEALQDQTEFPGVGSGYLRSEVAKQVFFTKKILEHFIYKNKAASELLPLMLETQEEYQALVPYFTFLQSYASSDPELAAIVHFITSHCSQTQPLRFIRDLFSKNPATRSLACKIIQSCSEPEQIQNSYLSAQENLWELSALDPAEFLTEGEELESYQLPSKDEVNLGELKNLISILKSEGLEASLKVASAEQMIVHLLCGKAEEVIDELITISIKLLATKPEDRAKVRLVAKSLQILVVVTLNYSSKAAKVYEAGVKFVCSLLPLIFSKYPPVRYYCLYLLYLLVFSYDISRNKFVRSELFCVVPVPSKAQVLVRPIRILEDVSAGFLTPFPVQLMQVNYSDACSFLSYWEMVPSSQRVKDYVFSNQKHNLDPANLLDKWEKALSQAENHTQIIQTVHEWSNLVLCSKPVNQSLYRDLLSPSDFFSTLLSILRVPPTNRSEDNLSSKLLGYILDMVKVVDPTGSSQEYDFCQNICYLLQRNLLPFITEASSPEHRLGVIQKVLSLTYVLLPHHSVYHPTSSTTLLQVLTRFQLQPGEYSLLSLLANLLTQTNSFQMYSQICQILYLLLSLPHLRVCLDLESPTSQELLKNSVEALHSKLIPFVSGQSFMHKHALKQAYRLFVTVPELINHSSYMWIYKASEDRESSVRMMGWNLFTKKCQEVYYLHPCVVDSALDCLFGYKDCFGVKSQACGFLVKVTEMSGEMEEGSEDILKVLYSYGVVSNSKSLLYENTGPSPAYFSAIMNLLYNMAVLDTKKISGICIQLDIWDALVRLIRPKALSERVYTEQRKPCAALCVYSFDEVLYALIALLDFTVHLMYDVQIAEYLLESTHILAYCNDWLQELADHFDEHKEALHGKAVSSVVTCIHIALYKAPKKAIHRLEGFSYGAISDLLDVVKGLETRLSILRLTTCLLEEFPIGEESERIILHLLGFYKEIREKEDPLKEISCALSCFIYHSESAKNVAILTGFANELFEEGKELIAALQNQEIQKRQTLEDSNIKSCIRLLSIFRFWSAGSTSAKAQLAITQSVPGPLIKFLFNLWNLTLNKEKLHSSLLQTLATLISESPEAKKAMALTQSKQSILGQIIHYVSRPTTAGENNFWLCLKILGSICSSKEARQLLIKTRYPQGLAQRLVKIWNECKDPNTIPIKSSAMIEFMASFAFYSEGQKVLSNVGGLIEVLVEVLDRYCKTGMKYEVVENSFLLLRNLCFSTKAHVLANEQSLPLLLAYISSPQQKSQLRALASSALWALLYHNQKVKGILSREQVLNEIDRVYKEVNRDIDRANRNQTTEDLDSLSMTSENLNSVLKICVNP